MKKLKNFMLIPLMAIPFAFSTTSCNVDTGESLTIWTFTNELKKIGKQYQNKFGKKVNVVVLGEVKDVVSNLLDAYDEGVGVPDIVALESAVVKDMDIQPYLTPLNDIEGTEQMYEYTKSVASNEQGDIFGLAWQATPGGFFYKKRLADKMGLTEQDVANYLSSWNGFFTLAEICNTQATPIKIVSSITEPIKVFMSARENPWVVKENNKYTLQLENVMFGPTEGENANCFDVVRDLQVKHYTHESVERQSIWNADVNSETCLGYFASCWGLNYDIMSQADVQSGWRMCKAPIDYFKGGTWLSIPKLATHVNEAKDFIKYVTTNEEFLTNRCHEIGDFMNNKKVMQEIVKTYTCSFLDGQNHYSLLMDVADHINGNLISAWDNYIDEYYRSIVADYAMKTTDAQIETNRSKYKNDFRTSVKKKWDYIDTQSYVA